MILLDSTHRFTIDDPVYGREEVDDAVLVDLLNSGCVARAKGINQYGPPREWYHTNGFSRYDHCVGVMILLRRLGAAIEEQVAGLLHDASHYAFSHVADWVLGSVSGEDNADIEHGSILRRFGVDDILPHHGLVLDAIVDNGSFSLLEQPAPALCADRLDYTLREVSLTHKDPEIAARLAASLRNVDGRVVFDDSASAREFAMLYLRCNAEHWAGPEAVVRYHLLSEALIHAMRKGLFKKDDLLGDDHYASDVLRAAGRALSDQGDGLVDHNISMLERGFDMVPDRSGVYLGKKKFRWVDPEFVQDGVVVRLSEVNPDYLHIVDSSRFSLKTDRYVRPVPKLGPP